MSDTLDVAVWRGNEALKALKESDPEEFERIMTTKFKFVDKADVAAEPVLIDADDDEDDDDEEEMVEKKPKTTRAAAKKKRTSS